MKHRTLYLLIFICCMSLLSAANGNAHKCQTVCTGMEEAKVIEQLDAKAAANSEEKSSGGFSPFELFTLSI